MNSRTDSLPHGGDDDDVLRVIPKPAARMG